MRRVVGRPWGLNLGDLWIQYVALLMEYEWVSHKLAQKDSCTRNNRSYEHAALDVLLELQRHSYACERNRRGGGDILKDPGTIVRVKKGHSVIARRVETYVLMFCNPQNS